MRTKIKKLIENCKFLDEVSKKKYLCAIKFLPEENLSDLLKLFEKEEASVSAIEDHLRQEESGINKSYLEEMNAFYKKTYKEAVEKEENEERSNADSLLNSL